MTLHGVMLVSLFCLLHETVHRTPFRSGWLNDVLGNLCGFLVMLPPVWFRHFHVDHHRYTQVPGKDPELAEAKPRGLGRWLWYVTGLGSYWWSMLKVIVRTAAGRVDAPFVPAEARPAVVREARIYLAAYLAVIAGSVALGTWAAVIWWAGPALLGMWALRGYLLAEHTMLPYTEDMLVNTRTTRSNAIVRWLAWQMPYHTEHHVFLTIPFHALPATHDRIAHRLVVVSPGYLAFNAAYVRSWRAAGETAPAGAPR